MIKANVNAYLQASAEGDGTKIVGVDKPMVAPVRIYSVKNDELNLRIEITFDIMEGSLRGVMERCTRAKNNGKWWYQGTMTISYKDDYMSTFKAFITALEESNPSFKWQWDETKLNGLCAACCFGEVESQMQDGKVITLVKPRWFRSLPKFRAGQVKVPEIKKLKTNEPKPSIGGYANPTYGVPQQSYPQPQYQPPMDNANYPAVDDKDLPF